MFGFIKTSTKDFVEREEELENKFLTLNSFTGPVQNNAKSLEIKFKKAQQMQIVKEKIDELFDEANRKVIRGSDHLKCQYEIYQNDIKSSEEILRYETLIYA